MEATVGVMQAAVLYAPGDLRSEEVPLPAFGPGEVLLEVAACGVCGSDLDRALAQRLTPRPAHPWSRVLRSCPRGRAWGRQSLGRGPGHGAAAHPLPRLRAVPRRSVQPVHRLLVLRQPRRRRLRQVRHRPRGQPAPGAGRHGPATGGHVSIRPPSRSTPCGAPAPGSASASRSRARVPSGCSPCSSPGSRVRLASSRSTSSPRSWSSPASWAPTARTRVPPRRSSTIPMASTS